MRANQNCKDHWWFQTWCNKSHNYSSSYKPKKKIRIISNIYLNIPTCIMLVWYSKPTLSVPLVISYGEFRTELPAKQLNPLTPHLAFCLFTRLGFEETSWELRSLKPLNSGAQGKMPERFNLLFVYANTVKPLLSEHLHGPSQVSV